MPILSELDGWKILNGLWYGALQLKEMSNWIAPTVKQLWKYTMHCYFFLGGGNLNTTAFCLGRCSLHLLLLKSSMPILTAKNRRSLMLWRGKMFFIGSVQCDQMIRLLFQNLAIQNTKNCLIGLEISQSRITNLPNTKQILQRLPKPFKILFRQI